MSYTKEKTVMTDSAQKNWHKLYLEEASKVNALEAECARLKATKDCLESKNERMSDSMHKIKNWTEAYPLQVFPEPDMKRAAKVLKGAGMTLDAISASNMRHVLSGIKGIVDDGLTS